MKMQISTMGDVHRKYFSDSVPDPLPNIGDFVSTKYLTFFVTVNGELVSKNTDNVYIRIHSRVFFKTEENEWALLLSGTVS